MTYLGHLEFCALVNIASDSAPGNKQTQCELITSAMKVMFSSLSVARVCLFICLSVCLPVSNITEKRLNGLSWNFQGGWDLIQGTIGNICRILHSTPWTQDLFSTFSEESITLSSIEEKRLNGFSWNFHKRADLTQGAIWDIFGVLRLTAWILGRFIYFLDPCFMECQARH